MSENPWAFPQNVEIPSPGMTLRDWFAGQVAPVALSIVMDLPSEDVSPAPIAAQWAYELADAMLAERVKGGAE